MALHTERDRGTDNFSQLTTVGDWNSYRDIGKSYHVHCSGIYIHMDTWTAGCVCAHLQRNTLS